MAAKDQNPPDLNPATAPDPDEDDLDDLDEMLDEFAAAKIDNSKQPPPSTTSTAPGPSGPGRPESNPTAPDPQTGDDEFANQLQAGMAEMLRDLESNPEMAKQFEELMAQFGAPPPPTGATSTTTQPAAPAPEASKATEDSFQDTIRRTMERMKESSSSAAAASSRATPADDDMMATLMKELAAAGAGDGGEGDDAFSKMLLGMMEQLTNKEILYDPMKELATKFPPWLQTKGDSLSKEDKDRYDLQNSLVQEIVARFERAGYSDKNAEDREFIVDRMQKMQAAGAPPAELVGDVNAAEEIFGGAADAGCPQQ